MFKNLLPTIALYRKAVFFLSILPTVSILLGFYAQNFAFKETAEPFIFRSPISNRTLRASEIQGVSSSSADENINEVAQTQATLTARPRKEVGTKEEPKAVTVTAKTNRINFPNNKFGVHTFANEEEMDLAAQLVNSNGGDWGWVTMTMDINERNSGKWNSLFTKLLDKHLIPIVQLSNNGKIPSEDEIEGIGAFLSGLGWPVKIRPVTVFSEVNASEYWGGKIDPEGYARILNKVVESFKGKSQEFFIMNGAFNASARTGSSEIGCIKTDLGVDTCYLSEIEFLKRMEATVPGIFKKLDGWAVHSYPHPAYKGRPSDTRIGAESAFEAGRNTIRSYQFELRLLSTFGVNIPVFITETGWPHREGKTERAEWYDKETVAQYYGEAFRDIFLPDSRVVAITPFILKYDSYDNFAFISSSGEKFPQWNTILSFTKTAGSPPVNR